MQSVSLDVLTQKAKQGSKKAFSEIVRRTYADTYTLAYRLVGTSEDAKDVVQETYLKAHKGLQRFRGDAQITTWLYRITANCANTYLSKKLRHKHDVLENDEEVIDLNVQRDPAHMAQIVGLRSELTEALEQLPAKLRTVVVLRDIYDMAHADIAEQLQISESAAKVRLHRGRQKLKELLYPQSTEMEEGSAHAV